MGVTGLSSTVSLGDITVSSNPIIIPTGFGSVPKITFVKIVVMVL